MRVPASLLWMFLGGAAIAIALGMALLRTERLRAPGWVALVAGLGALALMVLAQLTGKLGLEQLWFRAPTFYLATAILLFTAVWWLRRPAPAALRLGLPALVISVIALAAIIARLDGRSVPLAMLMPTLEAPAPELSYFDDTGHKRMLSELRGQVVLLNFWATWCAPCRKEMPMLSKLQREHADQGLVVLYLSLEDADVLAPFLATNHFDGIQGRLDNAAPYYDAGKFYPLSYLISRDGRVAHRWSGRPREEWLTAQVAAQL